MTGRRHKTWLLRWLSVPFGAAVALGLLYALIRAAGVTIVEFGAIVQRIGPIDVLLLTACTIIHFSLSAYKWRYVTQHVHDRPSEHAPRRIFLTYTVLGALIGQALPFFFAMTATRAVGLRLTRASLLKSGTGASVLEQGFDLMVPLILVIPGLLVVGQQVSLQVWASLSIGLLILCGASIMLAGVLRSAVLGQSSSEPSLSAVAWRRSGRWLGKPWFEPRVLLPVYWLSVIRYANLVLRAQILAGAVAGTELRQSILYAMPLVQISNLAALTPGGLGITEWTWTGVLTALGSGMTNAARFGLTYRMVLVPIEIAIALAILTMIHLWNHNRVVS